MLILVLGGELPGALHRLGAGGSLVLPADRLLVLSLAADPSVRKLPYPPPAQLKAFVTTRLGDFGFLIGILILFFSTENLRFRRSCNSATTTHGHDSSLTLAMILVFCGAVGKSAQFPLHVWLPDAMAGPTPVSALIHAATMVAAGVYLVARLFPIYAVSAGPAGATGGRLHWRLSRRSSPRPSPLTQNDIKGCWPTRPSASLAICSPASPVAPTNAIGMFHLFTHAFFKALLFLGSGCVIHRGRLTIRREQDMRKMGGLARFMPITAACLLVATLSISGMPPFSGFWSKDPIIATAYD